MNKTILSDAGTVSNVVKRFHLFLSSDMDNDEIEPIGWVDLMTLKTGVVEIYNLFIVHKHRGKGYGNELMHHVVRLAKGRTIVLWVLKSNRIARKLYAKCGFRQISVSRKGDLMLQRG